jgi:hypothetical protein
MAESIAASALFAFFRPRPGALGGIAAVGGNLQE